MGAGRSVTTLPDALTRGVSITEVNEESRMSIPKFLFPSALAAVVLSAGALLANPPAPLINPTAAPQPAAAPAGEMTVDDVLDALDKRGQDLKSFDGKVALTEDDVQLQLKSTRTGRVWYQKKGDGSARIRVSFDQRVD